MAQPYAGYSGYPPPQGAWAGHPGAYAGYQPSANYPAGYQYGSYYQQQPGYDYSAYYAQYTQPANGASTAAAPQPPAEAPPPLPEEAPPPLPTGEESAAHAQQHNATSNAATMTSTGGSTAAVTPQPPATDAKLHNIHHQVQYQYNAPAYGTYYQGAYTQGYGGSSYPSYDYTTGQYGSSSTNTYAAQVAPSPTPLPVVPSPSSAAQGASAAAQDYSRMPPPAALVKCVSPPAASGSNATPIGGVAASSSSAPASSMEAMRATAEAVAQRLTAIQGQSRPQYVPAGAAPAAAASSMKQQSKDMPSSLQQYVARALSVMGRSDETRLELRTVLRDLIAKHKKEGTLWSTDWDREPLPVLGRQARGSESTEASGRQQQHGSSAWSRMGNSGSQNQQLRDSESPRSSRKRHRHGFREFSDSDGSSDDGEGDASGSLSRKKKVDLGSLKGRGQHAEQRFGRKGKKGKKHNQWLAGNEDEWTAEEQAKHAARGARFAGGSSVGRSSTLAAYGWDEDSLAVDDGEFIVGTCQKLEKRYLRLTRAPLPEEVRPPPVLAAALQRLLGMIETQADKYLYYNDQFKAMRQDLTVQGIKSDFTVQVYEAHARAALEYGDAAEYNQCQTQLAILYAAGLPGSHAEFGAYRLLYQSVHSAAGEGRRLLGTMKQLLGNKVGQVAHSAEVQHAMQVREALSSSNVSRFFQLYVRAPRLGRCLMDVAVQQLRWKALNTLVRAHKPGVIGLPFLAVTLGFLLPDSQVEAATACNVVEASTLPPTAQQQQAASKGSPGAAVQQLQVQLSALTIDEQGKLLPGCSERSCSGDNTPAADRQEALLACLDWCKKHGAVFENEADLPSCSLLTKESWNKLFIPQDTTKVAHGDVNLDIRDFLAL